MGIGKQRTMISVTRLVTPVPMEKRTVLMHLAVLTFFIPLSQKAFTGTH